MGQRTDSPLIGALAERYRVVSELRAGPEGRRFVAAERSDGREVVIDVLHSAGSVGNDLAHLASDVQLLTTMTHPNVPRVLEGRWLDATTYACVSERVRGDTLQERLDRGDRPANAEIATILNDVKAVLDWARDGGVVHRGVTPDAIVIENDTKHLFVSLGLTRIPMAGPPGEAADARTIGALAWSMFTGRRFVESDAERPSLAELCPNLAARVVDATERILHATSDSRAPDAAAYIGIVAVGDVLKRAEVEFAALDEEFASQFGDRASGAPVVPPARLLDERPPSIARESIFAAATVTALVLLIALGIGLAGRSRHPPQPVVAQQMPTVPAADSMATDVAPMRNDSILISGSANGLLAQPAIDSLMRIQDSVVRDSILRDRIMRARAIRDSLALDSIEHESVRRDSLDDDAFRRDSLRSVLRRDSLRPAFRRDSLSRDSLRRDSLRFPFRRDSVRRDSVRRDSLRRAFIRRDSLRRDSLRRRDSIRPDTLR